jgi:hypothetical protein
MKGAGCPSKSLKTKSLKKAGCWYPFIVYILGNHFDVFYAFYVPSGKDVTYPLTIFVVALRMMAIELESNSVVVVDVVVYHNLILLSFFTIVIYWMMWK